MSVLQKNCVPISRWAAMALVALLILFFPVPMTGATPVERTFHIQASQYAYNPAVLSVNRGDRVIIEFLATDVVHGLAIDGYNLETTSDPGQTTRLSFTADKQGTFRFRCSVTCGNMHPFMIGKIRVGRNELFWRGALLAGLALFAGIWGSRK